MADNNDQTRTDKPRLEDMITLGEAAHISGLSPDHLRRLAGRGDLWAKKIGRDWMTTEQAVMAYIAQNHHPGPKKKH